MPISAAFQRVRTLGSDGAISAVLLEAAGRIMSISVVHEILDASDRSDYLDLSDLFRELLDRIKSSICPTSVAIQSEVSAARAPIELALPVALLVNELVTNAIKHAFPGRDRGRIFVGFARSGQLWELRVSDDGTGMPAGPDGRLKRPRIVAALIDQLEGEANCRVDDGTHWTIRFRLELPS